MTEFTIATFNVKNPIGPDGEYTRIERQSMSNQFEFSVLPERICCANAASGITLNAVNQIGLDML